MKPQLVCGLGLAAVVFVCFGLALMLWLGC